ncbi:hypothetical protein AVEN_41199-1 [Araneus ventricosus]|uniref:Uncharacterized protein n=1 Tax=Araneus ventricosus TaxID=182803 RepID=A0A4Y2W203_ARAVE|nr:hypothetical protein AVEN_181785-1 [Araneus ventricosus]GBO30642.1 hypothetical protein AVEN_41199-1 [Araneus ventricosus]
MSSSGSCVNHPDLFCYICVEYTLKENRKTVRDFVKRAYLGYFGVRLGNQEETWAQHQVCKTCTEHLRQWTTGKRKSLKFGVLSYQHEKNPRHQNASGGRYRNGTVQNSFEVKERALFHWRRYKVRSKSSVNGLIK